MGHKSLVNQNLFLRLLLCAHSDVLCAMLDGNYLESDSGQLTMDDSKPEAVSALLLLLATGQVGRGELRRHALDLYVLCDKYNVSSLLPAVEQEAAELAAAAAARGDDRGLLRCLVTAHLHGSGMIRRAALAALTNRRKKVSLLLLRIRLHYVMKQSDIRCMAVNDKIRRRIPGRELGGDFCLVLCLISPGCVS